jgi:hypothetical protein
VTVHRDAHPAELERLRRFCERWQLTVDHLASPSVELDAGGRDIYAPLSADERRALGRAAYSMAVSEAALLRGLLRSTLRSGELRKMHDMCAEYGVESGQLRTPRDCIRVRCRTTAADRHAVADIAMETESTRGAIMRALVLAFLADHQRRAVA